MGTTIRKDLCLDASRERVWDFLSSPERRAAAIDAVEEVEVLDERRATWVVRIPVPLVGGHVRVHTRDLVVQPPSYVRFVAKAPFVTLVGEHELEERHDQGCKLFNRFELKTAVPGVAATFRRKLNEELPRMLAQFEAD